MKNLLTIGLLACTVLLFNAPVFAQTDGDGDDLLNLVDDGSTVNYTFATFKAPHLVTGRTVEMPGQQELNFVIAHRFGRINQGWRDFFGLDQANIRFGIEYGALPWLSVGWGRSNVEKFYDGFVKMKFLRQSTGAKKIPITGVLLASIGITSARWSDPSCDCTVADRVSYAYQIMLARKFNRYFSLQIMPTWVHRNLVETTGDKNDIFSIGAGARVLLTKSVSLNGEYYYLIPNQVDYIKARDAISIGIDIETGGHVFQIVATNTLGMVEQFYVPKTTGRWLDGDIHLGFNINRVFTIGSYENMQKRKAARQQQKNSKG